MPATNGHQLNAEPMTEGHRRFSDEAEQLLAATSTTEMRKAAEVLRLTALDVQRQQMRPLPRDGSLHHGLLSPDPELRRVDLADLAVDVVTATDYLLRLLNTPAAAAEGLTLADEAGAGYADQETFDRLARRRLDARGTAVRLGMRLLSELQGLHQA